MRSDAGGLFVVHTVSGAKLVPVNARFVVSDYIKTEMSEYDSNYVFVSMEYLQKLRTMENRATSIQIKLKDERQAKEVVKRLQVVCQNQPVLVQTWEDKQGPLLDAIAIEIHHDQARLCFGETVVCGSNDIFGRFLL